MPYNIAVIEGDGIGPEVTKQAVAVLKEAGGLFGHAFNFTQVCAGGDAIDKFGEPLPAETLDKCLQSDAVLLGAVGGAKWEGLPCDKRPERALLDLRKGLSLYANLRPAVLIPAMRNACPLRKEIADKGIDIMVVRELTGGIYFGESGTGGTEKDMCAWDTEKYSFDEIWRIAETAFKTAAKRRKKVVSVDKANVLESSRLWRTVVTEAGSRFPDIELSHMYVDNAAMQLVRNPSEFDVLLTTNMFGDILSDEASQLVGSIGLLPSASVGSGSRGMYEPIHGSAPEIAGTNTANPIAAVLSAAMMLRHSFQLEREAAAVENAVLKTLDDGIRTLDIFTEGFTLVSTVEMGGYIRRKLRDTI